MLKSSRLSYNVVVSLPFESISSKILRYEVDVRFYGVLYFEFIGIYIYQVGIIMKIMIVD
jgi:hypothetical protein